MIIIILCVISTTFVTHGVTKWRNFISREEESEEHVCDER